MHLRRAIFALAIFTSGCMTNPLVTDESGNHRLNLVLDDLVCGPETAPKAPACRAFFRDEQNPNAAYFRLFRAHVTVTALAELGAARMHSLPDKTAESYRLLSYIRQAESKLVQACAVATTGSRSERAYYPIPRADALIAVAQIAAAATHPSRRRVLDLYGADPVELLDKGAAALNDAVKDMIYAEAYSRTLRDQVAAIADNPAEFATAWKQHGAHLEQQCRRLAEIAGDPGTATCAPARLEGDCLNRVAAAFKSPK